MEAWRLADRCAAEAVEEIGPARNESNVLFARRKEPLVVNSRVTGQLREMQVKDECNEPGGNCKKIAYFGAKTPLLAQHPVEIGLEMRLQ
ncbi:MAG: hypothetical protein AB7G28_03955 [Pirellulales bacterium]